MPRDPYKLDVFSRSHALSLDVYRLSKRFPPDERYGLTSQLRRAATSVPTNIVEGCVRLTASEYRTSSASRSVPPRRFITCLVSLPIWSTWVRTTWPVQGMQRSRRPKVAETASRHHRIRARRRRREAAEGREPKAV